MLLTICLEKVAAACQEFPLHSAVVYGSQAKGCARARSGYDVAIWVEATGLWEVADAVYCRLMDQLLGTGEVSVSPVLGDARPATSPAPRHQPGDSRPTSDGMMTQPTPDVQLEALAQRCVRFADRECGDSVPFYDRLAHYKTGWE